MLHKKTLMMTAAAIGYAAALNAAPVVVEEHGFDADAENWLAAGYPSSDMTANFTWNSGAVGSDGGFLQISGNSGVGGEGDFLYTANAGSGFIGNWNNDVWGFGNSAIVSFDLYADTGTAGFDYPAGMYLYFESDDGAGGATHEWWYDLSSEAQSAFTATPDSWQSFSASIPSFGSTGGWGSPTGGTFTDWTAGFESVTEFGVYLSYPIGDSQFYGLDDFDMQVPIPEPGAMMLLGSALLSLSITFRKQIKSRTGELMNS